MTEQRKLVDYSSIAQVLVCIGVLTFLLHGTSLVRNISLAIAQTPLYSNFVEWASYLLPTHFLRWAPARYLYLFLSLACYGVMLWWEGKPSYPRLLTKQPIFKPLLIGFLFMSLFSLVWFGSAVLAGYGSFSFVPEGSVLLSLSALGLDFLIKISNDLAEELIFRGYSITRLSKAVGPLFAVWVSAILFMLAHYVYIDVALVSLMTAHWTAFAVLAGYVYLITRSIYYTVGMHLGLNVFGSQLVAHGRWIHIDVGGNWQLVELSMFGIAIIAAHIYYIKHASRSRGTSTSDSAPHSLV